MKAALAGRAFYLEVVDETRGLADELIEALAREPTVRGAFVQRMLERLRRAAPGEERTIRRALVGDWKRWDGRGLPDEPPLGDRASDPGGVRSLPG